MPERKKSCCFTGHRPGKLPWGYKEEDPRCCDLKRRIYDAAEAAYEEGFRHFLCGMAQGCDQYFCECVLALREKHEDITIEAAIPCPEQADAWPEQEKQRYRRLVEACSYETVVSSHYTPYCMQRRDRYMVDHAALVIAVFDATSGGTRYTIDYAIKTGVPIADLPVN